MSRLVVDVAEVRIVRRIRPLDVDGLTCPTCRRFIPLELLIAPAVEVCPYCHHCLGA